MYLIVNIDDGGYMRSVLTHDERDSSYRRMVHKATRNMHTWAGCYGTLAEARKEWEGHDDTTAILELDRDGGGSKIWMSARQYDELVSRLGIWKGCYGLWSIRRLND